MKNKLLTKTKWQMIKSWIGIAALGGAGFLPCPDCGAPMIFHFWPIALVLALRNLRKNKNLDQVDETWGEAPENME